MKFVKYNHLTLSFTMMFNYIINDCAFLLNSQKVIYFFLLISFQVDAQFFVSDNTAVYIDKRETLYVKTNEVFLFSKIDIKGKFIIDNTRKITISNEKVLEGIIFIDKEKLTITNTKSQVASNERVEKVLTIKKVSSKIYEQCLLYANNNPRSNDSTYLRTQITGIVATYSFKNKTKLQLSSINLTSFFFNREDATFLSYSKNYPSSKEISSNFLQYYLIIRPPPLC